jgi:hypothetical protein
MKKTEIALTDKQVGLLLWAVRDRLENDAEFYGEDFPRDAQDRADRKGFETLEALLNGLKK